MTVTLPRDPLALPLPPMVVRRYKDPKGRVEVALRSSVWIGDRWWSCLDRTFAPGAGFLTPHRHAHTEEVHFVREGTVRYLLRGRLRTAYAGEAILVPAGAIHADPWATKHASASVTSLLSPASADWVAFGMALGDATRRGRLNRWGQPPLPLVMRAVHTSGADVLAPIVPAVIQRRAVIPTLAAIGGALWSDDE